MSDPAHPAGPAPAADTAPGATGGQLPPGALAESVNPAASTNVAPTAPQAAAAPAAAPAGAQPAATPGPASPQAAPGVVPRDRPCILLSRQLVNTYKTVNEKYFQRRRAELPEPRYNGGYDDREGHYIVLTGEEILQRYTVQEILGKGSFGTVVKGYDSKRCEQVALKVTRSGSTFRNQAKQEIDIILKLNNIPALTDLVARILKVFDWKGHLVLSFELYSYNLYQLLTCTNYNGVSLDLTRKFAWQILQVLQGLQQHDPPIIHCDLKPENVLLKHNNRSGIRVIDFGSACYEPRRLYKYIQSRFYRAPEVILNLEYGTAIDRWSLGVMLVELHHGMPLFDGRSEAQQLQRFEGVLGPLPAHMAERAVRASTKAAEFFVDTSKDGTPTYELKLKPEARHMKQLQNIIGVTTGGPGQRRRGQPGHDQADYEKFYDFVSKLIQYDPAKRMSVAQAMAHPFIVALTQQQQQAAGTTAVPAGATPATTSAVPPAAAAPAEAAPAEKP